MNGITFLGFLGTVFVYRKLNDAGYLGGIRKKYTVDKATYQKALGNFQDSIRIKTISDKDEEKVNFKEFDKFITFLEEKYPLVHEVMEVKKIHGYSLMYFWKGKNKDKKAVMLTAHYDVVDAVDDKNKEWIYEPFSGHNDGKYIWGRGTLDDKLEVISMLEAAEYLLSKGFTPERTIIFGFGHDEEVGGKKGAVNMAKYLEENDIHLEFLLDEGGCVSLGAVESIYHPIAVFGIGERGYSLVELSYNGNSDKPARVLYDEVKHLLDIDSGLELSDEVRSLIDYYSGEKRDVFSIHKGLDKIRQPALYHGFARRKVEITDKLRSIQCDFRIYPGTSTDDFVNLIEKTKYNKEIEYKFIRLEEPSELSTKDSYGYKLLKRLISHCYSDSIFNPTVVVGGTDSKKYKNLSNSIYRFIPIQIRQKELNTMHRSNEKISIANFRRALNFYVLLLDNIK